VPRGSYEVTLVDPRYAPIRVRVEVNDHWWKALSVTRSAGGSLAVTVRDSGGNAVPRAEVSALDGEGRDFFDDRIPARDPTVANPSPSPFTTEDGTLVLGHVRPGQYRVAARRGAVRSGDSEVTVTEGETATVGLILTDG